MTTGHRFLSSKKLQRHSKTWAHLFPISFSGFRSSRHWNLQKDLRTELSDISNVPGLVALHLICVERSVYLTYFAHWGQRVCIPRPVVRPLPRGCSTPPDGAPCNRHPSSRQLSKAASACSKSLAWHWKTKTKNGFKHCALTHFVTPGSLTQIY